MLSPPHAVFYPLRRTAIYYSVWCGDLIRKCAWHDVPYGRTAEWFSDRYQWSLALSTIVAGYVPFIGVFLGQLIVRIVVAVVMGPRDPKYYANAAASSKLDYAPQPSVYQSYPYVCVLYACVHVYP